MHDSKQYQNDGLIMLTAMVQGVDGRPGDAYRTERAKCNQPSEDHAADS